MFEFTGLSDMKGWMNAAANPAPGAPSAPFETGVVISSRVRLSRNLSEYSYPGTLSAQEQRECQERILSAFRRLPEGETLRVLEMDDLTPLDRRILFERNVISQGYSLEKKRALLLSDDGSLSAVLGDEDHLRLSAFGTGSCLETLLGRVDAIDSRLEAALPFAVSPEWGYLNTAITNLGTGLKASMMLHLPALSMGGLIKSYEYRHMQSRAAGPCRCGGIRAACAIDRTRASTGLGESRHCPCHAGTVRRRA
jgi:protein-arginine kinase